MFRLTILIISLLWASVLLGQGREDEAMEKYRAALEADAGRGLG